MSNAPSSGEHLKITEDCAYPRCAMANVLPRGAAAHRAWAPESVNSGRAVACMLSYLGAPISATRRGTGRRRTHSQRDVGTLGEGLRAVMCFRQIRVLLAAAPLCGALACALPTCGASTDSPSVKVFILAGQSNMEGQAVADLEGEHFNAGRGTLKSLMRDPMKAGRFAHLASSTDEWSIRDDVTVWFQPQTGPLRRGSLSVGFTAHEGCHHFGPELQFGHVLGDALENPVLIIKTAWGGKSLYTDFRPPSSEGPTGPYYSLMIQQVREALSRLSDDRADASQPRYDVAGFVWHHGWNDGCDPEHAVPEYEANLVHLIKDVRRDLNAPSLPVVIGELTGPWLDAPGEWDLLRRAQAAAAAREEWNGSVLFVPTAAFVRAPEASPNPTHGHHEFGNAETCLLVGEALGQAMRALVVEGAEPFVPTLPHAAPDAGELSGYMLVPVERAPEGFNAGFSLYAAAWPLVERHPGSRFQTGLFGTWMFAQHEGDPPKDLYSDIEGGLGWWRDTRFPTPTPKFIMGGVAPNFSEWANGPGAGKGRDWDRPLGKYGIAQLSPWVLWPPDGLNLAQGTCGELFGYGYLPLPLIDAKSTTAGRPIPTGDQCWTLFLNTANFKGPVCFFTPYFWSAAALERPELAGMLLDTRPSDPNKAFQMETQWVPARISTAPSDGGQGDARTYARTANVSFPVDAEGRTIVLHRLTTYTRHALSDPVRRWFAGGPPASGAVDPRESHVHTFGSGGASTWKLFREGAAEADRREINWGGLGTSVAHDPITFGYTWKTDLVRLAQSTGDRRARLPEFFRLDATEGRPAVWTAVAPSEVPRSTGLHANAPEGTREDAPGPYETPTGPASPFRSPGPVAGPFTAVLGDGSVVTYAWYRFADQPAMLNADLTAAERETVQRRVEQLHRHWTRDKAYLPAHSVGTLASVDPALIVTPPAGLEVGHVPIALRQERPAKPR